MKLRNIRPKRFVYLDYAAATPLEERVMAVMQPFFRIGYGNPSSLHAPGRKAKQALELSRKAIADIISARTEEIIFTAGGTESCNLAIFGVARALGNKKAHFITTAIEHPAVLEPFLELKRRGHHLTLLGTDSAGFVLLKELEKAVRPDTLLVSIMHANNEIGTLQPIPEVGRLLKKINQERFKKRLPKIYFHTDACQAAGLCDLSVGRLGTDLMSVNGGKIYGPKQSGFLYIKNGTPVAPLIFGGGQERGLRSGTENVAFAAGLAKAMEITRATREKETARLFDLQNYLYRALHKAFPELTLNGPKPDFNKRLVNNLNLTLSGIEGETMLLYLDAKGIAVSTGSACGSNKNLPSHVLGAIGLPDSQIKNNIRISLGSGTTKSDLDYFILVFGLTIKQMSKVVNEI